MNHDCIGEFAFPMKVKQTLSLSIPNSDANLAHKSILTIRSDMTNLKSRSVCSLFILKSASELANASLFTKMTSHLFEWQFSIKCQMQQK
jgi:hypothetical protein